MTEAELTEHLSTLLGYNVDQSGCSNEPLPSAAQLIDERLPETITADHFLEHLLGFGFGNCAATSTPHQNEGDTMSRRTDAQSQTPRSAFDQHLVA